eukprot:6627213-Prymnesium_polylepis.1
MGCHMRLMREMSDNLQLQKSVHVRSVTVYLYTVKTNSGLAESDDDNGQLVTHDSRGSTLRGAGSVGSRSEAARERGGIVPTDRRARGTREYTTTRTRVRVSRRGAQNGSEVRCVWTRGVEDKMWYLSVSPDT